MLCDIPTRLFVQEIFEVDNFIQTVSCKIKSLTYTNIIVKKILSFLMNKEYLTD